MSAFIAGLDAVWLFLTGTIGKIFNLYVSVPIFVGALALWVLDRIFGIFKLIKG